MTKVHCSVDEQYVNPLFEVFDGGDFILSSYHDIEEPTTQVQIYFADPAQTADAVAALQAAIDVVFDCDVSEAREAGRVGSPSRPQRSRCDRPVILISEIPDEDWKLSYRRHFKTEHVSARIFTRPPWEPKPETPNGEIVLTLDPGMAFGTGKHETTKACLRYIDEIAASRPCEARSDAAIYSFLDMGCGSGILSIAAAKLGFAPVAGFDIDEEAVQASVENARVNGVAVDYHLFALGKGSVTLDETIEAAKGVYPDLALNQTRPCESRSDAAIPTFNRQYDVVVANILGPLLIAFADEIASYVKESLIVSGILEELYPEVLAAFTARGFTEVSRQTLGEWTTGLLRRA